jgi:hypothetical protein
MKRILLIMLTFALLLPALAETDQQLFKRSQEIDKVIASAQSVDQVFPYITSASVERIKQKDQAGQEKVLSFMQMGVEMTPEGLEIMESKIGSEQAALTVGVEEDGMSISREIEFRKEDGKWKLDLLAFLDQLQ